MKSMDKTKRLALLGLLLLVSVGFAVAAQATNVLPHFGAVEDEEINIQSVSVSLILSSQERQTAINLVLDLPQIQQLINAADSHSAEASEIFDIQDLNGDLNLVPKQGVAKVTIDLNTDYGEEFGVQTIIAIVDLKENSVTQTDIEPEVRRPKVQTDALQIAELLNNPQDYEGVTVTVTGEVSLLGEVFGSLFMLDSDLTVFYNHPHGSADISNITNGDAVTVTGIFESPSTLYALSIEKT